MQSTTTAAPRRDPGLDGLRGLACLAIVVAHGLDIFHGEDKAGGLLIALIGLLLTSLAVFFSLSAFLLYRPFAQAVVRGSTVRLGDYARNRILRIFPAYLVAFALSAWVLGAVVIESRTPDAVRDKEVGHLTDPLLALANLTLTQNLFPSGFFTGLLVSWSLVTELTFYLVLPALWLLARGLRRAGLGPAIALLTPALVMIAIGFLTRVFANDIATTMYGADVAGDAMRSGTWVGVLSYSLLGQADLFGVGMLAAAVTVLVRESPAKRRVVAPAGVLLVLGVLAVPIAAQFRGHASAVAFATACLLAVLVNGQGMAWIDRVIGFLRSALVDRAGTISYSIYLWHFPLAMFLHEHVPGLIYESTGGAVLAVAVLFAVTLPVAELSYRGVEKPAMQRKRRYAEAAAPSGPGRSRRGWIMAPTAAVALVVGSAVAAAAVALLPGTDPVPAEEPAGGPASSVAEDQSEGGDAPSEGTGPSDGAEPTPISEPSERPGEPGPTAGVPSADPTEGRQSGGPSDLPVEVPSDQPVELPDLPVEVPDLPVEVPTDLLPDLPVEVLPDLPVELP